MTAEQLIEKFSEYPDCKKYTAWSGKTCYKTIGSLSWYFLLCDMCGISWKMTGDFTATAKGNGYELEWVEEDVILALEQNS